MHVFLLEFALYLMGKLSFTLVKGRGWTVGGTRGECRPKRDRAYVGTTKKKLKKIYIILFYYFTLTIILLLFLFSVAFLFS